MSGDTVNSQGTGHRQQTSVDLTSLSSSDVSACSSPTADMMKGGVLHTNRILPITRTSLYYCVGFDKRKLVNPFNSFSNLKTSFKS